MNTLKNYPALYEEQKTAVLDIFDRYVNIRGGYNDGIDMTFLNDRVTTLRESKYLIAVVGEAKHGKSKFINALLGEEIVPTDVKQCTSSIIEIMESSKIYLKLKYANKDEKYTEFNNSDELNKQLKNLASVQEKYRKLPIIQINDFLVQQKSNSLPVINIDFVNKSNWTNEYSLPQNEFLSLIKSYIEENKKLDKIPIEINVGHPLGYDFTQMRLVDTPGVHARGGIEDVTLNFISKANAAILIHSYKNIGDSKLFEFYSKKMPNIKKESLFLFITHSAHIPKHEDRVKTLDEAVGLFPELNGRIELIDSMQKLVYDELSKYNSIGKILEDRDKEMIIAPYAIRHQFDIDKVKNAILIDSNFEVVIKKLKDFSGKARSMQLIEIVSIIKEGYNHQATDYGEYISLNKNKIEKTPDEFAKEIGLLKKSLDEYQRELNDFSQQKNKEYKGAKGKFAVQFDTMKNSYVKLIVDAQSEASIIKYISDFNYECEKVVSSYCEEMNASYNAKMTQLGLDYGQKHYISPPKINVDGISTEAKKNAYDNVKIDGNQTLTSVIGAIGGGLLGFFLAGPVGAVLLGAEVAAIGAKEGRPTEYKSVYNESKYLSNIRIESKTLVSQIADKMSNALSSLFDSYDIEFRAKLNDLIVSRKDVYQELVEKEKEQVPIYNQIDTYEKKIEKIEFNLKKINILTENILNL